MSRVRSSDFEITERHVENAFNVLTTGADAFDVVDRLQLDVVTEVFCGESTYSLTSNQQPFRNAMDTLLKIASFRQLLGYKYMNIPFLSILLTHDSLVKLEFTSKTTGWLLRPRKKFKTI
jgi:hypothetical protein